MASLSSTDVLGFPSVRYVNSRIRTRHFRVPRDRRRRLGTFQKQVISGGSLCKRSRTCKAAFTRANNSPPQGLRPQRGQPEFRRQSIFSRGGRPRWRGSWTMPRRWEMTSTQSLYRSRAGHGSPTTVRHPTPWPVVPHGPSVASGPDVPAQCDRAAPIPGTSPG